MALLKAFDGDKNDAELVKEPKRLFKKEFVAKIKRTRKEKGREIFSVEDFWENTDNL